MSQVSGYTAAAVAKAGGSIELQKHTNQAGKLPSSAAAAPSSGQHQQQQQQPHVLGHLSAKDGVSAIHSFVSFLLSLTHADADGRIIIQPPPHTPLTAGAAAGAGDSTRDPASRGGQLRYVLLNAAHHFGKLLSSARSVLLVSGTLAPVEGLAAQLFPDIDPTRVKHFECGHVVPPQQLLTVSIGRGPSGRVLDLRHEARSAGSMKGELGQLLVNLCGVVPEGLVVFVPSFGYLEQLREAWRESGVWERLAQRKKVFRCG
jgi:chromosome transmission fidelity protein 1